MKPTGLQLLGTIIIGTSLVLVVPLPSVLAEQAGQNGASQPPVDEQRDRVRRIQQALIQFGYKPGPPDGVMGGRTRRAIGYYQGDYGLKVDGEPSAEVLAHMEKSLQARGIKTTVDTTETQTQTREQGTATEPARQSDGPETWETGLILEAVTLKLEPQGGAADGPTLAANTSVEIVARDAGWLKVAGPRGETGWVRLSAVKLDNASQTAEPEAENSGGFMQGLARGLTGLFGGGGGDAGGATTATIGIRGLSKEALAAAEPNPEELVKMEGYRALPESMHNFASERGLTTRSVNYLPDPSPVQNGSNSGPGFSGGRK